MNTDQSGLGAQPAVIQEIRRRLREIEDSNQVRILLACESGSRAWGFASRDSDYDVRFLYLHPPKWYLSVDLEQKRDVIECPVDGDFEISGWDLRKALKLFRKSNPPLLEWLGSPIVYLEHSSIPARMRESCPKLYAPNACRLHYLHMARRNYRDYLKGETVARKKYFYVLRPLLAMRWIEAELGIVPTRFDLLVERLLPHGSSLRNEIESLLAQKRAGVELGRGRRIPEITAFIREELVRHETAELRVKEPNQDSESLSQIFREALDEVWSLR